MDIPKELTDIGIFVEQPKNPFVRFFVNLRSRWKLMKFVWGLTDSERIEFEELLRELESDEHTTTQL